MKLNKQLMQALDNLVFVSRNKGKYKEALDYMMEKVKLEKMIVNNENLKNLYQKEAKLEIEKQEAIANERAQQDKIRKQFLIACLVLALLIAVIAIRSFIIKRRSNAVLQKQNNIITELKSEVEHQKHIIEEKQKEIVDSINYAKRIQYTLLAHEDYLKKHLPQQFVLFKPKDIVSGDFYWATSIEEKKSTSFYLAVCDSTGHGVPGAFMSLLNIGFLSEAINEKEIYEPNKVLDHVRSRLINSLSKDGQKDGFDGIVTRFENDNTSGAVKFTYAAAHNAPILIRNGEVMELEADRMPVGMGERKENFKLYEYELLKGDVLYLYTDGFADQFGGPKGKKFKYKQLNELLQTNAVLPLEKQKENLLNMFENWRGNLEQVDDVCIIGIRI
ncbi:MAG: PP2C family protein-serine/threonine phosphatase [Sphingobacteriaceae bacterium]|jgi:serine phosphatase RsbU (regulator of sigma subunit)